MGTPVYEVTHKYITNMGFVKILVSRRSDKESQRNNECCTAIFIMNNFVLCDTRGYSISIFSNGILIVRNDLITYIIRGSMQIRKSPSIKCWEIYFPSVAIIVLYPKCIAQKRKGRSR